MRVGCWLSLRICVLCSTFWHKMLSLDGAELCSCPEPIVSVTRIFPVHSFFFLQMWKQSCCIDEETRTLVMKERSFLAAPGFLLRDKFVHVAEW